MKVQTKSGTFATTRQGLLAHVLWIEYYFIVTEKLLSAKSRSMLGKRIPPFLITH